MNHYKTLWVPYSATAEEIKKTRKSQVFKNHPDRHKTDWVKYTKITQELNGANDILKDKQTRLEYDMQSIFNLAQIKKYKEGRERIQAVFMREPTKVLEPFINFAVEYAIALHNKHHPKIAKKIIQEAINHKNLPKKDKELLQNFVFEVRTETKQQETHAEDEGVPIHIQEIIKNDVVVSYVIPVLWWALRAITQVFYWFAKLFIWMSKLTLDWMIRFTNAVTSKGEWSKLTNWLWDKLSNGMLTWYRKIANFIQRWLNKLCYLWYGQLEKWAFKRVFEKVRNG